MSSANYVNLATTDGSHMDAYLSFPQTGNGPFPGLLLFQEAFGVNGHIRSVADKLAAQGYIVIAPELFHRAAGNRFEGNYNDFPSLMPIMQSLTVDGLEADATAAYNWLHQHPAVKRDKIGSIGFCMGGRVSFLANMILPLSASVSYYAGSMLSITNRIRELHGPQLMFWGGLDTHITANQVEAVVKALGIEKGLCQCRYFLRRTRI